MEEIIDIEEARRRGLTHYFTGVPCNKGHISKRYTSSRNCVDCGSEALRAFSKEKKRAWSKLNREKNREKILERQRKSREENPAHHMLSSARYRARKRGLEFSIGLEDVIFPSDNICPVLGIPLSVASGRLRANSPSLDRINNSMGYIPGNVMVISSRANTLKSSASVDELNALARYVNRANERDGTYKKRDFLWVSSQNDIWARR